MAGTQFEFWNEAGGQSWVDGQRELDAQLAPFGALTLDAAALRAGETVLDVGCGCGTTTVQLADGVGPSGRVVGADISEPMVARARATVNAPNVEFLLGDAASMPLPEHAFDVLFSRFGVMFFDAPVAGLAHLRSTLRPDGRVAWVVWQPAEVNEWVTVPLGAIADVVEPVPMGDASTPGPFAFGDPDYVRRVMGDAGYADIRITPRAVDFVVGGGLPYDESIDFLVEYGLLRHVLGSATPPVRAAARDRLAEALESYEQPDGVHMASAVWMVTARGS
jgi:SAM-dependent methyltransferase